MKAGVHGRVLELVRSCFAVTDSVLNQLWALRSVLGVCVCVVSLSFSGKLVRIL